MATERKKGEPAFLEKKEIIIGEAVKRTLAAIYPRAQPEEIIQQYPDNFSEFFFTSAKKSPSIPIAVLGIPGIAMIKNSYLLQAEPLAVFGTFVDCNYPLENLNKDLYFAQLSDLISRLKSSGHRIVLVGESMGGTLAAHFTNQETAIDGLVLICSPLTQDFMRSLILRFYKSLANNEKLSIAAAVPYTNLYRRFSTIPSQLPAIFKDRLEQAKMVTSKAIFTRGTAFVDSINFLSQLAAGQKQITPVKTLLLFSEKDHLITIPSGNVLQSLLPNSAVEIIPGHHSSVIANYQDYNPLISRWLEEQVKSWQ